MIARAATVSLILLAGCAPKPPMLPGGGGTPFPDFANAYAQATDACRDVRTISAVLSMSGRAGKQKLRGRIDAGLEAPDRIVLEAIAPFGRPFFVLAAAAGESTLVLPRDGRFLKGAAPAAIVEAITGVSLTPAELRLVLAGCGVPGGQATAGHAFGGGWVSVDSGDATTWLRQIDGRWRIAAATRQSLAIHYSSFGTARPSIVRIRVTLAQGADLTLRLGDVDVNVPLDPGVFKLEIPRGATPITLEELRRGGPLGRQ